MISLRNLHKSYRSGDRTIHALNDVTLDVKQGEIFGVVGQSGAGKSTLIRCVNMLETPDSGTVTVAGRELTSLGGADLRLARHDIGMVFQHFNLLSSRTALGNVEFALEIARQPRAKRRERALEILDLVGLADRAHNYPAQLSGGQKQRVGIARALAGNPKVLLSDEATSALDPETTRSILDLIKKINRELGLTVLLITHEMEVVKRICDSAALMADGRILEQGPISQLITSPNSALAHDLFPMGDVQDDAHQTVVEITFTGQNADEPVISQLVRRFDLDVSILGASIENLGAGQAGRIRLGLPTAHPNTAAAVRSLTEQGLFVEVRPTIADRPAEGGEL